MEKFTQALNKKLRTIALSYIDEARMRYAADVLEESQVPMAGYQIRNPESRITYTIEAIGNDYRCSVLHPGETVCVGLGRFATVKEAVGMAKEHHAAVTTFTEEQQLKEFSFFKGRGRPRNPDHDQRLYSAKQELAFALRTNNKALKKRAYETIHSLGYSGKELGF